MTGVAFSILVILFFIILGAFRNPPSPSGDEFFFMNRSASVGEYSDTTVGYSLQVAVTVYFVYFGYRYGWDNIAFIVTWSVGFILFAFAMPAIASAMRKHRTMLAILSPDNTVLRRLSAALLITSLSGLVYTELYFSSQFLANVSLASGAPASAGSLYWLYFALLLFSTLVYAGLGGMRKVVLTEKIQLSGAYLGLATLLWLLRDAIAANGYDRYVFTYLGMGIVYALLCVGGPVATSVLGRRASPTSNARSPMEAASLANLVAAICAICMLSALLFHPTFGTAPASSFPKPLGSMWVEQFGWVALAGFGLINMLWQFSDYTAYDRLSVLRCESGNEVATYRASIAATAMTSPITWAFGVFIGMAIDAAAIVPVASSDVFGDFYRGIAGGSLLSPVQSQIAVAALGTFFVCVMLSTSDAATLAAAKLVLIDFVDDSSAFIRRRVRYLSVYGVVIAVIAVLHTAFQFDVFVLLNGIYSWGLIFGPVMLYRLFSADFQPSVAIFALSVGAVTGFVMSGDPLKLPAMVSYVAPSVSAISITALLICAGIAIRRLR